MTIELTPDLESALAEAARRQGTTPDLLAQAYLWERLDPAGDEGLESAGSLADFLEGYVGVLEFDDKVAVGSQGRRPPGPARPFVSRN